MRTSRSRWPPTARCSTPTAARRCGCPRRRWTGWSTAPGPGTRSSPASCPPGWTRSRRARRWPAAAGWPRTRSASSAPGLFCEHGSVTGYLNDLFSLDGRVAVVTGGSSGIGAGMAAALARAGARVVLVARDAERLEEASASLRAGGAEAAWVSADLGDRAGVARAASGAEEAFGPPDILVNCAGINLRPPLGSLTVEDWDATMAVNLTAPFL